MGGGSSPSLWKSRIRLSTPRPGRMISSSGKWGEHGPCRAFAAAEGNCLIYTSCSQVKADVELPAELAYLGSPASYKTCKMQGYDLAEL
mmetsp:Transcript_59979/g.128730  ORF Transcript_59979/g.128730 Transcript_59979/m.128730 type:complete len:89 (+) Transcript_59979:581-847(+)